MPRWSSAALAGLLAAGAVPARAKAPVYDPEIALLLLTVQKQSVDLVREELVRQAEWLDVSSMRALLSVRADSLADSVRAGLTVESDVIDEYRRRMTNLSTGEAPDVDRLVGELRRYHGLLPGPPLARVALPPAAGAGPSLIVEDGVGADVAASLSGTPLLDEPVVFAERRFGTTGPFLRRRKWNLDFYLGSFSDLIPHYRKLGYRRLYRLRAPYVSFGRSVYALSPEPGLRPRLVYCEFFGQDMFLNARAQWSMLTRAAQGQGPLVRTLTCPSCAWTLPGVAAMAALVESSPYAADEVVVGYDPVFAERWGNERLGVYENDYWRLTYYRHDAGTVATVESRHTNYGEILAASLGPLIRRGARRVFYAGPAAVVDDAADPEKLVRPSSVATYEGQTLSFVNALGSRRRAPSLVAGLPSPLLATREWRAAAKAHGVVAFDGEIVRLVEEAARWTAPDGGPVALGVGAVLGGLASLHPEEDRAFYTVESSARRGQESAKAEYRDAVLAALTDAARGKSR